MLRDVVRRRCRRWAHAPVIHVASHFYHGERVAWVSISMHACDPVPIVMGLRLVALRRSSATTEFEASKNPVKLPFPPIKKNFPTHQNIPYFPCQVSDETPFGKL